MALEEEASHYDDLVQITCTPSRPPTDASKVPGKAAKASKSKRKG